MAVPKSDKKSLVVVGALAVVRESDGKVKYLYRGADVPDNLPTDEVERLVELGLIGEASNDVIPGVAAKSE